MAFSIGNFAPGLLRRAHLVVKHGFTISFETIDSLSHGTFNKLTRRNISKSANCCFLNKLSKLKASSISLQLSSSHSNQTVNHEWPLRYVTITTSHDRWLEAPNGLQFDVGYVDTQNDDSDRSLGTVVALHDSPGKHTDLLPIMYTLSKLGYRVIAPNFPGFGVTQGIGKEDREIFMHSTAEKAEFLGNFLEAIDVFSIDLVLGHGAGCNTVMKLCADTDLIKAAMFVCPFPHGVFKAMRPYLLLSHITNSWESQYRFMMYPVLFFISQVYGLPYKVKHMAAAAMTLMKIGFGDIDYYANRMCEKKFPLVFAYSGIDRFLEANLMEEYANILGATSQNTTIFNELGHAENEAESDTDHYIRGIFFKNGSHYPQRDSSCNSVLVREAVNILNHESKQTEHVTKPADHVTKQADHVTKPANYLTKSEKKTIQSNS